MKSKVIIFVIVTIAVITLISFLFINKTSEKDNVVDEVSKSEQTDDVIVSDQAIKVIDITPKKISEEERTAKLQACIIALLGPEKIIEFEKGNGEITPVIKAKIQECEDKINKGEL